MKRPCLTLILLAITLFAQAQVVKMGDVNRDNDVNVTDVTELVNIILTNHSSSSLTFSNVSMTVGSSMSIPCGDAGYTVQSSDADVVEGIRHGSSIILTAMATGTATITVTDTQSGQTATIAVAVASSVLEPTCSAGSHPHAVDLGLPSGTKWACCNVGGFSPISYGRYYAWGETADKSSYEWSTYLHCDGSYQTCHDLGSDIAGTEYDVAHVLWGGFWVMPSQEQIEELLDNCVQQWVTIRGVNGLLLTGPNAYRIFLPATGYVAYSRNLSEGNFN